VVASPVAIEGMDLEPGRHLLVAATPEEYRAQIDRIFHDRAFVDTMLRDAQAHVRATYGPAARTAGIRSAVAALIERP
jgi:hypothetical protein